MLKRFPKSCSTFIPNPNSCNNIFSKFMFVTTSNATSSFSSVLIHQHRFVSSSTEKNEESSSDYSFEDFLNDNDFVGGNSSSSKDQQQQQQSEKQQQEQKTTTTITSTQNSSSIAQDERKSNLVTSSDQQNKNYQQQKQKQQQFKKAKKYDHLEFSRRPPHSLSEFLRQCNELVVEAKKKPGDSIRRNRVELFWKYHVSKMIEMYARNGHDLACIGRAGRGYRLIIPPAYYLYTTKSSSSTTNNNKGEEKGGGQKEKKQNNNTNTTSAVFIAWSILLRYENVTRCSDLIAALWLLVKSQPKQSTTTGDCSENKNLQELHANHQKFVLNSLKHYFGEIETTSTSSSSSTSSSGQIRCPPRDYESICDVLEIFDSFTKIPEKNNHHDNNSGSSNVDNTTSTTTTQIVYWQQPPHHVQVRMWQLIGTVHRLALPQVSPSLSFSQLVQCVSEAKILFVRCQQLLFTSKDVLDSERNLLRQVKTEKSQFRRRENFEQQQQEGEQEEEKTINSVNDNSATSMTTSSKTKPEKLIIKTIKIYQKSFAVLRDVQNDIRVGTLSLFEVIVAQATTLDKFVNSYHFQEVVFAAEIMGFFNPRQQRLSEKSKYRSVYSISTSGMEQQDDERNSSSSSSTTNVIIRQEVSQQLLQVLRDIYIKRTTSSSSTATTTTTTKVWKFSDVVDMKLRRILDLN